jgi:hypothetical protein
MREALALVRVFTGLARIASETEGPSGSGRETSITISPPGTALFELVAATMSIAIARNAKIAAALF